jgi:hypothetical protein
LLNAHESVIIHANVNDDVSVRVSAEDAMESTTTATSSSTAAAIAAPELPAARPLPLRRNLQFQTLWIGMTASTLGVSVADIAYPLAILAMTRSPALAGLFAAVQALGMLAAGLPSGVLADRYDSRMIVICTEAACGRRAGPPTPAKVRRESSQHPARVD